MACSVGWKSEPESLGEGKLAGAGCETPLTTIDAVGRGVDDIEGGLLGMTVFAGNPDGVAVAPLGNS